MFNWIKFDLCHYFNIARYRFLGWICYWQGHQTHTHWTGDRWEGTCDRCCEPDRPTFDDWVWQMKIQRREWFPGPTEPENDEIPF